jgi:hypothetical protein
MGTLSSRRVAVAIVLPPMGLLLGIFAFVAHNQGVNIEWARVPDPPESPFELSASREGALYITGDSQQTYVCENWRGDCWSVAAIPPDIQQGWTIVRP